MLAIEMKGITKRFGNVTANSNVNLQIKKGEIHCLLGENGAGKTTLMKILFGLYQADEGSILINEKAVTINSPKAAFDLGLGMVHQHFMLIKNMTVLENIILGHEYGRLKLNTKKAYDEIKELSDKYGFQLDLNKKISELSVGMMQRVEILKTVYHGAEILILDEPTAVLTPQEVESLLQILDDIRHEGKTIIFITHKLNETMKIADSVSVLRGGTNVAAVRKEDTTPQKLASLMVGRDISFLVEKKEVETGKTILKVEDVRLIPQADHGISFDIKAGEIFGIAGVDGNGQQQLEEGIMGLYQVMSGSIYLHGDNIAKLSTRQRKSKGIAYVPSDRLKRGIVPGFSVMNNYLLGNQFNDNFCKKGIINAKYLENFSVKMVEEFNVKTDGISQKIGSLSGGNQQKMVLSREVSGNPSLVIVAQPVRGLDIGAIEYVHNILLKLREEGKAILLISTELSEIIKLSDRIGVLYKGEFMAIGNTKEYTTDEIGLLMAGRKGGNKHEE